MKEILSKFLTFIKNYASATQIHHTSESHTPLHALLGVWQHHTCLLNKPNLKGSGEMRKKKLDRQITNLNKSNLKSTSYPQNLPLKCVIQSTQILVNKLGNLTTNHNSHLATLIKTYAHTYHILHSHIQFHQLEHKQKHPFKKERANLFKNDQNRSAPIPWSIWRQPKIQWFEYTKEKNTQWLTAHQLHISLSVSISPNWLSKNLNF